MLGPAGDGRGWVLIDDGEVPSFGASLVWARRHRVGELHVLVEGSPRARSGLVGTGPRPERVGRDGDGGTAGGAGELDGRHGGRAVGGGRPGAGGAAEVIARRAGELATPPLIWRVDGRRLSPARPASANRLSEELARAGADGAGRDAEVDAAAAVLRAHGVEPLIEHGVLRGEVLGLEVARLVVGEHGPHLVVGVGRHDRDARREMRPGQDVDRALEEVVTVVRAWRRHGVAGHPANTTARARWLRAVVCDQPALVGAGSLSPAPDPLPAPDLRHTSAAPAYGRDASGAPLVVVCSTGVDVDLVPTAADSRHVIAPDAQLVLAVPEGDDLPITRELGAALARPAEVRTVPRAWTALTPPA